MPEATPYSEDEYAMRREAMVRTQLASRDITDPDVLRAMQVVPRHRFLTFAAPDDAYADHPLRIGCRQTISQPYIVALMTQLLEVKAGMRVLEVGTGSGYQSAVLAELGAEVYTIERHEELLDVADAHLETAGYSARVYLHEGDGTLGIPQEAPFDRIIVTAAGPDVPESLLEQLADPGRMVIPVGRANQVLEIVDKKNGQITRSRNLPVVFVPLIGQQGLPE